ncbi:MAG: hypothetical protein LUF35_08525 [Lachnospiraceae bacterium]|nr:hypothetical protein [Lachnospiraceae bacterium]
MRYSRRRRENEQGLAVIIVFVLSILFFSALKYYFTNDSSSEISYDASELFMSEELYEWNGHSYYIFSNVCDSWESAKAYCEALGGYLAVISGEEENAVLYAYLTASGYSTAYFGYSDSVEEGVWVWVSDEDSEYTNWASGEPNSESGKEDYAEFYWKYTDGTWNDGSYTKGTASDQKNFICEWSFLVSGETTDVDPAGGGTADSGAADSGTTDGGAADSGATDSGATDDGIADSGTTDNGTTDSGAADSGATDSGATDNGAAEGSSDDSEIIVIE